MISPEGYKVLVEVEKIEEKTESGLIIPETVRDTHQRAGIKGKIKALGPDANVKFGTPEHRDAEIGDSVYFAKYGGFIIEEDGTEYRILNDEDIVALIT